MVQSELLYAASVWPGVLQNHAIQKRLFSVQRGVVLKIIPAYKTVSTSTVLVLARVPPTDLLAKEKLGTVQLHNVLTCITDLQEFARA